MELPSSAAQKFTRIGQVIQLPSNPGCCVRCILRSPSPPGLQPSQKTFEEDASPNHSNGKDTEARPFNAQNI